MHQLWVKSYDVIFADVIGTVLEVQSEVLFGSPDVQGGTGKPQRLLDDAIYIFLKDKTRRRRKGRTNQLFKDLLIWSLKYC